MPTGSLPAVREALGLMTYPPAITSVRAARRFVQDAVAASDTPHLADDAGLLASELAANAVLHARTDFDVAVYSLAGGIRVSVRDRSEVTPVLVAPSATAMSGRGLALVQTLASRWGAGPSASAVKSVWFELSSELAEDAGAAGVEHAPATELSVDELLAAWSDEVEASAQGASVLAVKVGAPGAGAPGARVLAGEQPVVQVVLPALDAVDLMGAKEAMEDVLRELQLVLLGDAGPHASAAAIGGSGGDGGGGGGGDLVQRELAVAAALDRTARDFADVRGQVRHQVSRAVAAGQERVELTLELGPRAALRAAAYAAAVEDAEQLATGGDLLLSVGGALQRHRAVRRAYLLEVIAAASP